MLKDLNHAALVAFARPLVGADEAEDVVQAAYVKMLTTKSAFKGHAKPQTWACKVVQRVALDRLRADGRRVQTCPFEQADGTTYDPPAPGVNREAALDAARVVASLTPTERKTLEEVPVSTATLKRRRRGESRKTPSARARLREKLERLCARP